MNGFSCRLSFDPAFAAGHPHQVSLVEDFVERLLCRELKRLPGSEFPGFFDNLPSDYRLDRQVGRKCIYVKVWVGLPPSHELPQQSQRLCEVLMSRIGAKFSDLRTHLEIEVRSADALAAAAA